MVITLDDLVSFLIQNGKFKSAIDVLKYRTIQNPTSSAIQHQLALLLSRENRHEEACRTIIRACALDKENPQLLNNAGVIFKTAGKYKQALSFLDRAILVKPDLSDAHFNKGNLNKLFSFHNIALQNYDVAIKHDQNRGEYFYARGKIQKQLGNFVEAAKNFCKAVSLSPSEWSYHYSLGSLLLDLGNIEKSIAHLRRAYDLDNNSLLILVKLGEATLIAGDELGALSFYRKAAKANFDDLNTFGVFLFVTHYLTDIHTQKSLRKTLIERYTASKCFQHYEIEKRERKRVRVGFVSGDFRNHPVGFFLEGVLKEFDKRKFALIAFSNTAELDSLSLRIKPYFKDWIDISRQNDAEVARNIQSHKIDVLIDLSGHTARNRLGVFRLKPCPIQATWLGYFASTGIGEIDYLIGDPYVTPKNEAGDFSEEILQMPETYMCFSEPIGEFLINELPALQNGYVTFGCFNHADKVNSNVLEVWASILLQIENSRLILKSKKYALPHYRERVIQSLQKLGITESRIDVRGPSPRTELLNSYNLVDIALDPFPFPGVTTSVESLWMGVPLITKRGNHFLSHMGEMILTNANLKSWIAKDNSEYVEIAKKFAGDLLELGQLRKNLRKQVVTSPLFNAPRFARSLEGLIMQMIDKHAAKNHDIGSRSRPSFIESSNQSSF